MKYKRQLNPKCVRFFQKPSKAENSLVWYTNAPLGHNSIGDMMPTISASAGLSKRYTSHSLRSTTVHILDANEFAGRHITSITEHKSEKSLKPIRVISLLVLKGKCRTLLRTHYDRNYKK